MTDALIAFLANTGYYRRGYADAQAAEIAYEKGVQARLRRRVLRICKCGDRRMIMRPSGYKGNKPVQGRCVRCAKRKK